MTPLSVKLRAGEVFNLPPPPQGVASLLLLAPFDRMGVREAEGFAHFHGLVEATKLAFALRDEHVADPAFMAVDPRALPARGRN